MSQMHILIDENIPKGVEAFSSFGRVTTRPGERIERKSLSDVGILLVRSITPVNRVLLHGSPVRFVGSATTGIDHVDNAYLQEEDIMFAYAPGANADSVVEYVIAALLEVAIVRGESLRGKTVGIVGCGQIGSRLARRLPALGMHVLKNDPPLAGEAESAGRSHEYVALDTVFREADIVTLHVPLTNDGAYPTRHLIDAAALDRLKSSAWLVNTCRGPVVDDWALCVALNKDQIAAVVLDVWEEEPAPAPELIHRCTLATPHIAGHSFDGKLGGTIVLYRALCKFLGVPGEWNYPSVLELQPEINGELVPPAAGLSETEWLQTVVRQMYDIGSDDRRMRLIAELPPEKRGDYFTGLRRSYPVRRSFSCFALSSGGVPNEYREAAADGLQVRID